MQVGSASGWWVFLILLVAGGALYANHFDNSFQFDDFHSIVQNPSIRSFDYWRSWFTDVTAFSVLPENLNYRPLLLATYALSYRISRLEVWGFHLLNWLIHVGVSLLVYAIALRLFSYGGVHPVRVGPHLGLHPPSARGMALVAALIYLVHPLNSEPVNYISSRSESLATFFVLLAFVLYLERVRALTAGRGPRALGLMLLSAAAFAAGLLTKEIAITFPALVVLHDFVLARPGEERRLRAPRVTFYVLLAAMSVLYIILREQLIPDSVVAARSMVGRTTYFLTQLRAWVHYIGEFLWPARLSADTDFEWSSVPGDPRVQLAIIMLVVLAVSVKAGMRRNRLYAFGMVWFLLTLLPTSSVFPLAEPVNEHRPYLPIAGLTLAAVTLVFALASRPGRIGDLGRQGILCAGLAAVGTLLVLGTLERNRVWDTPRSLWTDVVAKSPGNGRAQMNLGLALMQAGDLDGAARHFDLAVERAPAYALAYVNRAILRRARGDPAGATADIEYGLRLAPDNIFVLYWAGKTYADMGDLARATAHLERARAVSPRHAESLRLLLDVEARTGKADLLPSRLAALDSLGITTDEDRQTVAYHLLVAGRHADAIPILEELLKRKPDDQQGRFNLGFAYLGLGRNVDARRELEDLLSREPRHRQAWQNLLWIHQVTGDRAAYDSTATAMRAALAETLTAGDAALPPRAAASTGKAARAEGTPPAGAKARFGLRAALPPVLAVPTAADSVRRTDKSRRPAPASPDTGRALR